MREGPKLKIDAFAHILPPRFLEKMLKIDPNLFEKYPYFKNELLTEPGKMRKNLPKEVKQIISIVNVNPEDYLSPRKAAQYCIEANEELVSIISKNEDIYYKGIAMLPLNNIPAAIEIIENQELADEKLIGVQLFTRALGKSIASSIYEPIFRKISEHNLAIWLHPIFDNRKPDNNLVFSWEYEISQAMLQIVQAGLFQKYPNCKVIVHHAGGMIPYFSERINHIIEQPYVADFRNFFVDTALLGNTGALELALNFFGEDHLLFGTDSPFGISPNGPTSEIIQSINQMKIGDDLKEKIFSKSIEQIITH